MNTAPSRHTRIIIARWAGIIGAALLLFTQQRPVAFWWVWLVAAAVTVVVMVAIQPITRVVLRHPLLVGIDIVFVAGMIVLTGGWTSPFVPVLCAVMMLPALLYGIRGAVLAGLSAGVFTAVMLMLHGSWQSELTVHWIHKMMVLASPLFFGVLFVGLGGRAAAAVTIPLTRTESPIARMPSWVGGVVRRAAPRIPRVFEAIRSDRYRVATAPLANTEALRVALYAPAPNDVSLLDHIRSLTTVFEQTANIPVRCVVLGRPKPIQYIHAETMRRIIIESLINVEQHAHARSASVLIRFDTRTVTVVIQDDGAGLPDTGIRRAGLHSLQMLIYRVAEVGGRLDVFATSAGGVAVRATYPLSTEEVIV
jgi:hypothetical protein